MTSLQLDASAAATQYAEVMGSGWPLTGRAEELQTITESLDTAEAAGIVLVGAAGVGKTRLARETLTRAGHRGRDCRFVAATASAQSVPLGAFADYAHGREQPRRADRPADRHVIGPNQPGREE